MVATLWGEHRVVGTRSQLPPPLADLDDDDEIWLRWCLETPNLGWWWVKGLLLCFIVRFPNCNGVREPDKLWLALIVQYTLATLIYRNIHVAIHLSKYTFMETFDCSLLHSVAFSESQWQSMAVLISSNWYCRREGRLHTPHDPIIAFSRILGIPKNSWTL